MSIDVSRMPPLRVPLLVRRFASGDSRPAVRFRVSVDPESKEYV